MNRFVNAGPVSAHSMTSAILERLSTSPRWLVLGVSLVLLAAVGYIDWAIGTEISLGAFYMLPILLAAVALNRWQLLLTAAICAYVRQSLLRPPISWFDGLTAFLLGFVGYLAAGLLVMALDQNRRQAREYADKLREQERLRSEVEEHLRTLAESSPAAILTVDEQGMVLSSNKTAVELLGLSSGRPVGDALPVLADALRMPGPQAFHTAAQCQGRRPGGEPFLAQTWFSTYTTNGVRRLAAIAVDISEEASEREEQNLRQLLHQNRIIAGAIYHELRNLCAAITLVYARLRERVRGEDVEEFRVLGQLVEGLERIAATELQSKIRQTLAPVDLVEALNHLRIIIEPSWREADGRIDWRIPAALPRVSAERSGLLQAFLNITQNSLRASLRSEVVHLEVEVAVEEGEVRVQFQDEGPGIASLDGLFQPFQTRSEHVGLGLYVSRALLRGFGGDLKALPSPRGACFVVILPAVRSERFTAV